MGFERKKKGKYKRAEKFVKKYKRRQKQCWEKYKKT